MVFRSRTHCHRLTSSNKLIRTITYTAANYRKSGEGLQAPKPMLVLQYVKTGLFSLSEKVLTDVRKSYIFNVSPDWLHRSMCDRDMT